MGFQVGKRATVALLGVVAEQLFDELFGLLVVDELGELQLALHDLFVDIVRTLCGVTKGQDSA